MTAADLAARLEAKRSGDGWVARCPAHDDRSPSLSIAAGAEGRLLLKCHAGCTYDDVRQALDLPPPAARPSSSRRSAAPTTYPYRALDGRLVVTVTRRRLPDGRKAFTREPKGVPAADVPVYRWPELVGHPRVVIVEGERDADRLWSLNIPATTNASGAGQWRPHHAGQLTAAGVRAVVLVPDNDDPGERHMRSVAAACMEAGLLVSWCALPDCPPKGDVSDVLDRGLPVARLRDLLDQAAPYAQPSPSATTTATASRPDAHSDAVQRAAEQERVRREARRLVDAEEAAARRAPAPQLVSLRDLCDPISGDELVQGVITGDSLCILWGPSNCGKTTIAFSLAAAIASGGRWCDRACRRTPVAVLAYEGRYGLRRRLDAAALAHGVTDLATLDLFVVENPPTLDDVAGVAALGDVLRSAGIGLVIVDTLTAACGGALDIDTGAGGDAATAVASLRRLLSPGGAVLAIHHCGHDPSRMRGAYALLAALDTELHAEDGIIRSRKQRDLPSDFRVSYRLEPMHDSVVMAYAAAVAPPRDDLRARVEAALAAEPFASKSAILRLVKGNKSRVFALIDELRGTGSTGSGTVPDQLEPAHHTGSAVPGPKKARNGTGAELHQEAY